MSANQSLHRCSYVFDLSDERFIPLKSKDKDEYNKLNKISGGYGFTLENAFQKNIFMLQENNDILFRGKTMSPVECTLFHLLGNENLIIDELSNISTCFFSEVIKLDAGEEKLIYLLKNLFQFMGWGVYRFILDSKEITMNITAPPYGLQKEPDNWITLIYTLLGYLRIFRPYLTVDELENKNKKIRVVFN